ncbi:MAG: YncE family protein [Nitrospirae bacterium]|nr:YncE family protein [Nitrospirota bacterium]
MKLKVFVVIILIFLLTVSLAVSGAFAAANVYVVNNLSNTVSVIDTAGKTVTATIKVGASPTGIAYNPTYKKAYVVNRGDNTVSVIDTVSHTVIGTIEVGTYPWYPALDPNIHNIDLNQWVKNFPVMFLYVTSPIGNGVNVLISTLDGILSMPGGLIQTDVAPGIGAFNVALDVANQKAYVVNCHNATLSILDLNDKKMIGSVDNLENTDSFVGVGIDTVLNKVYAVGDKIDVMPVIDTTAKKVVAKVKVGSTPYNVTVDSNRHKAYVANRGSNTVSVVNTMNDTVEATVKVGAEPISIALADGKAYVSNCSGNSISVIDTATNTVTDTIAVPGATPFRGMCPWGVAAF